MADSEKIITFEHFRNINQRQGCPTADCSGSLFVFSSLHSKSVWEVLIYNPNKAVQYLQPPTFWNNCFEGRFLSQKKVVEAFQGHSLFIPLITKWGYCLGVMLIWAPWFWFLNLNSLTPSCCSWLPCEHDPL